jgi:hypothetical protein
MLGSPYHIGGLVDGFKSGFGLFAKRALPICRKVIKFYAFFFFVINMTAYCTFVFHSSLLLSEIHK